MNLIKFNKESKNWKTMFFTIWGGQAFSLVGSRLVNFALIWWITVQTESIIVLTTLNMVMFIPRVLLGPFAGAIVDRIDRRKTMLISDALIAFMTLFVGFFFFTGSIQLWLVYVLVFFRSLGDLFHSSAFMASTPLMVPEKHLSRIAGINQMMDGGVLIIGPALGAILVELIPTYGILGIDIVTAMIAIIPLIFIVLPNPKSVEENRQITPKLLIEDFKFGLSYLVKWPGLLILVLITLSLNFLFTPISSISPLLIKDFFQREALDYGFFQSLMGIGMIVGGLIMSIWGGFKSRIVTMSFSIFLSSIGLLALGLVPQNLFFIALAAMFLDGVSSTMANASAISLFQTIISENLQGRILSIFMSAGSISGFLGLAIAGPFVDAFGIKSWFFLATAGSLLIGVLPLLLPQVRQLENKMDEMNQYEASLQNP